ncbi:MAG: catalase [Desulfurivibrio sp.]|nr:catalase [Desulfurivibrio sp.]
MAKRKIIMTATAPIPLPTFRILWRYPRNPLSLQDYQLIEKQACEK